MKKPVLVIMAAGMGSRYGGIKTIFDPIIRRDILLWTSLFLMQKKRDLKK